MRKIGVVSNFYLKSSYMSLFFLAKGLRVLIKDSSPARVFGYLMVCVFWEAVRLLSMLLTSFKSWIFVYP